MLQKFYGKVHNTPTTPFANTALIMHILNQILVVNEKYFWKQNDKIIEVLQVSGNARLDYSIRYGWQEDLKQSNYFRGDCGVRLANLIYEFNSVSGLRSQRFI